MELTNQRKQEIETIIYIHFEPYSGRLHESCLQDDWDRLGIVLIKSIDHLPVQGMAFPIKSGYCIIVGDDYLNDPSLYGHELSHIFLGHFEKRREELNRLSGFAKWDRTYVTYEIYDEYDIIKESEADYFREYWNQGLQSVN